MLIPYLFMLAQDAPPAVPQQPWWQVLVEGAFGLTILFIFLTAVISILVKQRKKDKCLKLLGDHHVSYINTAGTAMWGDLIVYSKGLEVVFDAAHRTREGIYKTSSLIYENDLAQCLAICRSNDALTSDERHKRARQIARTFRPNIIKRMLRALRNLINTFKDAFSKALSTLIGQLGRIKAASPMAKHQAGVTEIGQTLLGAAGNAYEPMLERHIGKPVVLQLKTQEDQPPLDLPGYLADYSEHYLAVFNVDHTPKHTQSLTVAESIDNPGYRIDLTDTGCAITCTGRDVLIVHAVTFGDSQSLLGVALLQGSKIELQRESSAAVRVELALTRRVDIVCPRKLATVCFGGAEAEKAEPTRDQGAAPQV